MIEQTTVAPEQPSKPADGKSVLNDGLGAAYKRLLALPPGHEYWKNKWMFTKPVFMNESRQGSDQKKFWMWAITLPSGLMKYITEAPNIY